MLATITVDAAKALYGTSYKVKTVADVFWPNYGNTRGVAVTEAKAHPGMLVSNGGKNYFVDSTGALREVTATGFTANRFKTAFVRPVASIAGYTVGAQITAYEATTGDRTQTGSGQGSVIPPVTGGALSVSLAADNPAAGTLASGTAFNPVLKVNLTAGSAAVTVTGLTIRKSGFAANSSVSGADVIDAQGVRHGNVASTLTSDNDLVLLFTGSPVVVAANSTQTLTVRVNLASGALTGTLQFSLAGASSVVANGSVSGAFPVSGNAFTLQNGSSAIGAVVMGLALVGTSTLTVDSTNEQDIAKFTLQETSSQENVKLTSLTLYNNGTAADGDVQDVQLVAQDGTVLATAQQSAKTVVFNLASSPYVIDKGVTKTFTVRAKIVNGAARTINFTVYNNYDAVLVGTTTGVSILPTTTSNSSASFPIGNSYNTATVGTGTLSFNKDVTSPSTAVTPGSNSVVLAKWFAKPVGENMELRQVSLAIVSSSPVLTGSVTLKVNGASVWSGSISDNSARTLTLSTYPVLTAGQNSYITVESNIMSGVAGGTTVSSTLDLTQVRRLITNDIIDPTVNATAGNTLTVQAGALKVTTLATPVAQSVVVGTNGVTLANFELNAGSVSSGEDIKVTSIIVSDLVNSTTIATSSDIGNLVMYDASGNQVITTGSTAVNGVSTTFTFATPIVIPKAGSVIITLKGDILQRTGAGTHTFSVASQTHVNAVGVSTGNSITGTNLTKGTGTGQTVTIVASGTVTLALVSGSGATPSADLVAAVGAPSLSVFAFKISAQNEPIKVTSLKLMATGTLNTANNIVNLRLYRNNESTPFATAGQMTLQSTTSTSYTWTATDNLLPDVVMPGAPVTIYVKADIGSAGQAYLGDSFRFAINTTGDLVAKGASSGTSATVTGAPYGTAWTYIEPFSVTVSGQAPASGSSLTQAILANTQLGTVKITNNGSAAVTITGVTFTDGGTHTGTTTTYKLMYSDQNTANYNANTASSSLNNSVNFTGIPTTFTIDGGSYRYVTVAIAALGSAVTGDNWQLSIAAIGDVDYTVSEIDLGYDGDNDGDPTNDTALAGIADGKPILGTLIKS
jgi:hypothetical protein